ncbi:MAG: hypothetical protein A2145_05805, partial [candidate division Zixibacteria bacterium RBG_16_40_9]
MKKIKWILIVAILFFGASQLLASDLETFKQRRKILSERMGKGIGLVFAGSEVSGVTDDFVANPDFYYLTGIADESGAILLLAPGEIRRKESLFLESRDPEDERWTGERLSIGEMLRKETGFYYIYRTNRLAGFLDRLLNNTNILCVLSRPVGYTSSVPKDLEIFRQIQSRRLNVDVKDCTGLITGMRLIKSPEEISLMKKAIQITKAGLVKVFKNVKTGMIESDVQILLENTFRENGALKLAFPSIIATGHNTTVLHYTKNNAEIKKGDLLLLDVGAEYGHYAADVTRTIPVSGKFSPEQRKIYEIVLKAQNEAMKKVKPGVLIDEVHETARKVIEDAGYGDYFIHGTS